MEDKVVELLEKRGQDIKKEWKDITKTQISKCESPIEKLFLIEWRYQTELYNDYEDIFIIPQYELKKYRVDFMVYYHRNGYLFKDKSLIVELDSYLWHGSTPDQFTNEKKRGRELKKEGYSVMRFSGREIYRNVEKCVGEVLEFISGIETKILEKELKEE